jgi:RNA polymerase sigma factor (sigma-70 family)
MDLDTLIATYRRPIERHLRRRVGDPSLAEDLAQEVFLRAPADLPEPRLRAWLYRVATNLAIDALRARRAGSRPTARCSTSSTRLPRRMVRTTTSGSRSRRRSRSCRRASARS